MSSSYACEQFYPRFTNRDTKTVNVTFSHAIHRSEKTCVTSPRERSKLHPPRPGTQGKLSSGYTARSDVPRTTKSETRWRYGCTESVLWVRSATTAAPLPTDLRTMPPPHIRISHQHERCHLFSSVYTKALDLLPRPNSWPCMHVYSRSREVALNVCVCVCVCFVVEVQRGERVGWVGSYPPHEECSRVGATAIRRLQRLIVSAI